MRQEADRAKVDELRGEMRREVEEAGAVPPVGLISKEMKKGVPFGIVLGGVIGAVLGAVVASLPILDMETITLWVRVVIGAAIGLVFGTTWGGLTSGGGRSEVVEQDKELRVEER